MKKISIITPCFNEEQNIQECHERLVQTMKSSLPNYDYEHIFADNSSKDNTVKILKQIALQDKHVKIIVNSRNVGPFRNMWNAMKSATGDAVIPMLPADLQDPPEVIPNFVRFWESGVMVTYGVRRNRQESIILRTFRNLYYKLIKKFSNESIPVNAGEFLLADRRVIDSILSLEDHYPYIRGLIAQTGVRYEEVEYDWAKRFKGKSKNNSLALLDQAINGFVTTSRIPARISLIVGFFLSLFGVLFAGVTVIVAILNNGSIPIGIPSIIVGVFFLGGIQLFFLGLIGEYVLSIHGQVRPTPPMFELERINFQDLD